MEKAKLNIPMCAALVLLLLTLVSIHLTSGLYARYTVTATGSDSARVAKFDVDTDLQSAVDGEGTVIDGQFVLTVTNHSEVSVKYSIHVTFTAPMSVSVDGGTPSSGEKNVTFTNEDWALAPEAAPVTHTLQFALTDWTYVTEDETGPTASKEAEFTVNVTAEQID